MSAASARLWVRALRLTDFRSHAALSLALDDRPVCLFGPNGAGKTNILEALAALAPGRGLRGAGLFEMARGGEAAAAGRARAFVASADLVVEGETRTLGVGAERSGDGGFKRVARLDGRPAASSDIAQVLRVSWATPAMDRLFAGSPGDRRRFLDRLTLARTPGHGQASAAYERALRERQRLLQDGVKDEGWLSGLEREMAAHGAAIATARAGMVGALSAQIAARPEGAFPKAALALAPGLEAAALSGVASADLEGGFAESLRRGRARDAAAGRTLEGPHRCDLLVRHAPKDMPAELCSTGEQKALLLGLLLAHAHALANDAQAGPCLLLLDEAAAHLDPDRRAALYDELLALPGQSWLTGTETALFAAFGERAQRVDVGGFASA